MPCWIYLAVILPITGVLLALLYRQWCTHNWIKLENQRLSADLRYWSGTCPGNCRSWAEHDKVCWLPY